MREEDAEVIQEGGDGMSVGRNEPGSRREELRVVLSESVLSQIDGSKELTDNQLRDLIEQRIRETLSTRRLTAVERVVAKRDVFNGIIRLAPRVSGPPGRTGCIQRLCVPCHES